MIPCEELAAIGERELGGPCDWRRLRPQDATNEIWMCRGSAGVAVLKRHRSHRGFEQERRALRLWLPSSFDKSEYPQLLAADEDARVLVFEALDLATHRACPEVGKDVRRAHMLAGAFVARLHACRWADEDLMSLAEALGRRFDRALAGAGLELSPSSRRAISTLRPDPKRGAFRRRVPCHRDFTPNNWWLRSAGPSLALTVLDFEHARMDTWLWDLVKLHCGPWRAAPELAEAFFAGHGATLAADDAQALRELSALHGLATLAWGLRQEDSQFRREGRSILEWVLGS